MSGRLHPLRLVLAAIAGLLLCAAPAAGHTEGESYIWLNVETDRLEGHFELRLADLRGRFPLAIPEEESAARAFLPQTELIVHAYLRDHFELRIDGELVPYEFVATELDPAPRFGHYAVYRFRTGPLVVPERFTVRNELFFDLDPKQRSLVCIEHDRILGREYGEEYTALIFRPSETQQEFDRLALDPSRRQQMFTLKGVARRGAEAWAAPAHAMFFAAALLPAGLGRRPRAGSLADAAATDTPSMDAARTAGSGGLVTVFRALLIAGCFTLAWAAGVGLSVAGMLSVTPATITLATLVTVVVMAASNLLSPAVWTALFMVALLGVVHGVHLAVPLADVPFRMIDLRGVLTAFIGGAGVVQLVGFVLLLGLILVVRRRRWYRPIVVNGGSLALAAAAVVLLVLPLTTSNGGAP